MPSKPDIEAENDDLFDENGSLVVDLLHRAEAEKLFGSLTVAFHFKAGVLTKRVVQRESTEIMLPMRQ